MDQASDTELHLHIYISMGSSALQVAKRAVVALLFELAVIYMILTYGPKRADSNVLKTWLALLCCEKCLSKSVLNMFRSMLKKQKRETETP